MRSTVAVRTRRSIASLCVVLIALAMLPAMPASGLEGGSASAATASPASFTMPAASEPPSFSVTTSVIATGIANEASDTGSSERTLVRDSAGGLHVAWANGVPSPDEALYSSSSDLGASWATPTVLATSSPRWMVSGGLKIDQSGRVHAFYGQFGSDLSNHLYASRVGTSGPWSAVEQLGDYGDEMAARPHPGLDTSGTLHLTFDQSHFRGVGYRSWNGSWTGTADVANAAFDFQNADTLVSGQDLYCFYARTGVNTLNIVHRRSGTWTEAGAVSPWTITRRHSEVMPDAALIQTFVVRTDEATRTLQMGSYSTTAAAMTQWTVVDDGSMGSPRMPSATIDGAGNVWVFYVVNDEILFRVRKHSTGLWTDPAAITAVAKDGVCAYPKARYQVNGHVEPDIIELTYRSIGDTVTVWDLNYARLALNTTPTAGDDAYIADVANTVAVAAPGVLDNDADLDGDALTAHLLTGATVGTVTLSPDGSFTYALTGPEQITDAFTYRAFDGTAFSDPATVTITLDTTPTANPDAYDVDRYGKLDEDAPGVIGNDTDPENDALTCELVTDAQHGDLALDADGAFRYTPNDSFFGVDEFAYRVSDGLIWSDPASATLTVADGSAIRGTATDHETGAARAGIVVRAVRADDPDPEGTTQNWTTVTDSKGAYRLTGLSDGAHYVTFCDRGDVYRDQHVWGEAVPIANSVPFQVEGVVDGVDAAMIPVAAGRFPRVVRVSGDSRYETAMLVAERFGAADTIVLASGEDYPDALAAAPLAGSYDAPILLTRPDRLPEGLLDVIDELGATHVVIVGGTAAVSNDVRSALQAHGLTVSRVSGSDRYETAAAIVRQIMFREGPDLRPEPWVVRGDQFADALAVAPFAWRERRPILLVRPDSAPAAAVKVFDDLDSDLVYVAGGLAAVGEQALVDLWEGALLPEDRDLWQIRLAGDDRYETAVAVLDGWGRPLDMYSVASGTNFPDALAGGPLMGQHWGGLLLTPPSSLTDPPREVLVADRAHVWRVFVLGGTGALSRSVENAIGGTIGTAIYDMDFLSGVAAASALREETLGLKGAGATLFEKRALGAEANVALRPRQPATVGFDTSGASVVEPR